MSEFELVYQLALADEANATAIQWWAGLSFGLVGLAHFGQKRLSLLVVVLLIVIYVAFTINIYYQWFITLDVRDGVLSELALLPVDEIAASTAILIANREVVPWMYVTYGATIWGPFFGAIWYLIFCYRRSQDKVGLR